MLIEKAQSEKLWEKRAWQKLLFIPDRALQFREKSLISKHEFFLATDGRVSPEHEMIATLNAFFDPDISQPTWRNMHSQCTYPARLLWLSEELKIDTTKVTMQPCEEMQKFVRSLNYSGVSLVFSNYFADNPGSLFGHTFLRLHRTSSAETDSALLDDIVNFAAAVPNTSSILYPIRGLMGGYKGVFSLMSYYNKIQEYNNQESRDLWEYELNLSQKETHMLELVLWEVCLTYIDYFYLDDNCAYVILSMLEAADPELYLTDKIKIYAIPSDTIRIVERVPNLVKKVEYRPSVLSRYLSRYSIMNKNENIYLSRLLLNDKNKNLTETFHGCDNHCQAHVIDSALEYIDFKEKLVGSNSPVKYADLRNNLLLTRANEDVKYEPLKLKPTSTPPDQGHDSGLVSLSGGSYFNGDGQFSELRWRPALHDIEANDVGYSDSLGIGFLDTIIRADIKEDLYIKNFHFLEITSLPAQIPNIQYMSWHYDSGYEKGFAFGDWQNKGREYMQVGFGSSFFFLDNHFLLYALGQADIGYANNFDFHIGPTLTLGAMARLSPRLKLIARSDIARRYSVTHSFESVDSIKTSATMAVYLSQDFEGRIVFAENENISEASLGLQYYF